MFARPAQDLVARLELAGARTLLDVGCGSGIVASAASACPLVVAVDPSPAMLRLARANGIAHVALAAVPGLPFHDRSFDRVTAGFVLSHVPSYADSLREMVRVLRPGGRAGVTAWSMRTNEFRDYWDGLAEAAVKPGLLKDALARGLPWEDWLGQPANLRAALLDAGLRDVTVEEVPYSIHMNIADFLAIREQSLASRFLRTVLDPEDWRRFCENTRAQFLARFRDPLDHTRAALIATGRA
jgi:SAM-dependent methyltransferase